MRAARSVLGWSVSELAEKTGVATATIKRYEASTGVPRSRKGHLCKLRKAFEDAGIEFIGTPEDRPGIRIAGTPED
jgi:transcriptional regulator with XRE-family HTH domain